MSEFILINFISFLQKDGIYKWINIWNKNWLLRQVWVISFLFFFLQRWHSPWQQNNCCISYQWFWNTWLTFFHVWTTYWTELWLCYQINMIYFRLFIPIIFRLFAGTFATSYNKQIDSCIAYDWKIISNIKQNILLLFIINRIIETFQF